MYIPRSEIAGSSGSSSLNFLKILHTVLHNGYTNLHPHNNVLEFFFPHPFQPLLFLVFFFFFMITSLTGMYCYLIVALICISLVVMLSILSCWPFGWFFWKKCLLRSSAHFLLRLFVFLLLSYISSLYMLNINL